jgi:S-DNA-T family DNA segregation ATPase FtsK/SpoIIIE
MLLWPEATDGEMLKTPLPRFKKAEMPPGRGFFVQGGKTWRVQLPWAG